MAWVFTILGLLLIGIGSFLGIYANQLFSQSPVDMKCPEKVIVSIIERESVLISGKLVKIEQSSSEIMDKEGNVGIVEVSVLSKEIACVYESTNSAALNGEKIDIQEFFGTPGMQERFNSAEGLIAVGAASQQGMTNLEVKRAKERANQLVHWLRTTVVNTNINLFTLNLGQFKEEASVSVEESSDQRRLVIISIKQKDENLNIEEALKTSLQANASWPYNIDEYSHFDLEPAT